DSLLLGVFAAMLVRDETWRCWLVTKRWIFRYYLLPILGMGLAVFTVKAPAAFAFPMVSFGYSWLAFFYVSILLYALLWKESWIGSCLRWKWLAWLGTIAYGTYLLHELVLGLTYGIISSGRPLLTTMQDLPASLLALAATLVLCRLSWKYFEKPLINLGHRTSYTFDSVTPIAATALL